MKVGTSHSPCGDVVASVLRTDLKQDKEPRRPLPPAVLSVNETDDAVATFPYLTMGLKKVRWIRCSWLSDVKF